MGQVAVERDTIAYSALVNAIGIGEWWQQLLGLLDEETVFSRTVPRFENSSLSEGAPTALSGSTGQAIAEEDTITHNAAISAYENVAEQSGDWIHSGVGALAMFGVMGQPYTNTCYAATCAGAGGDGRHRRDTVFSNRREAGPHETYRGRHIAFRFLYRHITLCHTFSRALCPHQANEIKNVTLGFGAFWAQTVAHRLAEDGRL